MLGEKETTRNMKFMIIMKMITVINKTIITRI